jgi:anti-anti-sigma factor
MGEAKNGRPAASTEDESVAGASAFALETLPAPAGTLVVAARGELDMAAAPRVRAALERGVEAGVRAVVLDLREVTFIDSSILKEMLRARALLGPRGVELVLVALQPQPRRVLELTGTASLFTFAASREEALRRVGGG